MSALGDEFCAAAMASTPGDFRALEAQGVERAWLFGGASRFGVAEIQPRRDGTYDPLPGGRRAVIVPAHPLDDGDDHDPLDLIAFFSDNPRRWWLRHGVASLLNPAAVDRAAHLQEPLRLWRSPLDWLRARGAGVVILDRDANLRLTLGAAPKLIVADVELGTELERLLANPPPPPIFVAAQT